MTRINVGVHPKELCDQHLVAEYRELPRLWDKVSKNKAPPHFKLGAGHCLWCQQYQGMLYDRFTNIVVEMKYRGFSVSYPNAPPNANKGKRPSQKEILMARPVVLDRIKERAQGMRLKGKQIPRWTKRDELY